MKLAVTDAEGGRQDQGALGRGRCVYGVFVWCYLFVVLWCSRFL